MTPGARTPEELETLLEDAFVIRDRDAVAELFERAAVVAHGARSARGERIAPLFADLWARGFSYVADPQLVLQARDTALIVAGRAISVVRRDSDAHWRYAITAIDPKGTNP